MMKIIYSEAFEDRAFELKKELKCIIEKIDKKDVFDIYVDKNLAYSKNDDFNSDTVELEVVRSKLDKFYKNQKLKNNSGKIGGLGNISFEEY